MAGQSRKDFFLVATSYHANPKILNLLFWMKKDIYTNAQGAMFSKWRAWTATLITVAFGMLFAGIEILLIFVIRGPYSNGVSWPVTFVGVLAAVLIISGYIPVPFEIVKRRGHVIGIDFVFLTIDWLGAIFSLMALGTLSLLEPRLGLGS